MRAHTNDRTDRACNQDTAESFIHFLSQKKKKNMMKRKDAMPNAFADSFGQLSCRETYVSNIKALMTSKTQSAVIDLPHFC